jgi:hypothetical protein
MKYAKYVSTPKNAVFWDVALRRYCVKRRFGGTYRLHLQGIRNPRARNQLEQRAYANLWFPSSSHGSWRRPGGGSNRLTGSVTLFKVLIACIVKHTQRCRLRGKTGENKEDGYFISCRVCDADVKRNSTGQAPGD